MLSIIWLIMWFFFILLQCRSEDKNIINNTFTYYFLKMGFYIKSLCSGSSIVQCNADDYTVSNETIQKYVISTDEQQKEIKTQVNFELETTGYVWDVDLSGWTTSGVFVSANAKIFAAAHPSLPYGSILQVSFENKSIVVVVLERCAKIHNDEVTAIGLSNKAMIKLGVTNNDKVILSTCVFASYIFHNYLDYICEFDTSWGNKLTDPIALEKYFEKQL